MCFSCSFALLGFGLSRAGGREKKILNPRCPSWTHSWAAAPWIPGVQVGHILGRQLPGSPVSNLDTFPVGRSPGSLVSKLDTFSAGRSPGSPVSKLDTFPVGRSPGSLVSKLDTFPVGRSPGSLVSKLDTFPALAAHFGAGEC